MTIGLLREIALTAPRHPQPKLTTLQLFQSPSAPVLSAGQLHHFLGRHLAITAPGSTEMFDNFPPPMTIVLALAIAAIAV